MALILDGTSPTGAWSMYRDLLTSFVGGTRYSTGLGVSNIFDQSGNGRNLGQGVGADQPALATAGPMSRACADLDGASDFYFGTVTLSSHITVSSGYIIVSFIADAVTKNTAASSGNNAVFGVQSNYMGLALKATGTPASILAYNWDGSDDAAVISSAITLGTPYVAEWRHEGGTLYCRLNGGTEVSVASGDTSALPSWYVGFGGASSGFGDIKLFEAATWSTVPSLATRNAIVADWMAQHVAATGSSVKVWTGSAWACKPLKVWNGSAWVGKTVKAWSGSAWVEKTCVAGDPSFASVVLLIGANGADGSTTFVDESPLAKALTRYGNAQIDTAQFKFGVSSALFDGAGDAITALSGASWYLSDANSSQFTIEMWVRFASLAGDQEPVSQWVVAGSLAWNFRKAVTTNELQFGWSTNGTAASAVATSGAGLAINTWYHVAVDKDATGKIRIYVDGVMKGSSTPADSTIFHSSSDLTIGAEANGTNRPFNGWIDELRITKGAARYASDSGYTVPTAAFPRS